MLFYWCLFAHLNSKNDYCVGCKYCCHKFTKTFYIMTQATSQRKLCDGEQKEFSIKQARNMF